MNDVLDGYGSEELEKAGLKWSDKALENKYLTYSQEVANDRRILFIKMAFMIGIVHYGLML
ncbi:hypothetical protein [Psittacicella hinzii]|uniref:Uncharacterized protein n=1 Tax=Psittacicella hinzii TaxID=2028575 RepID=A0A3A1YBD6_9GAMM|nr:hypothetical protein [Psittacicella hinzii]RIY34676.1 hypothetical protein CKF58_07905 [Psittacicella hinzii]